MAHLIVKGYNHNLLHKAFLIPKKSEMDSLWKEIFLENLVDPGLSGRCCRRAGGVGVRVELFPVNSPVFPGVYHNMQANVPSTSELNAELVV